MKDDRLRNPNFNPIDDPAKDDMSILIQMPENAHLRITLYDRLVAAALTGVAVDPARLDWQSKTADAHNLAMYAIVERARAFGVEARGGGV